MICHSNLHTDDNKLGIGAVLKQEQEGQKKVISYASRSFNPAEKNYPASKLEFLPLKWAITEKFNDIFCMDMNLRF